MLAGAAGAISVVANLVPEAFRALCDAATAGDQAATLRCRAALEPLVRALDCAPNPIAVKAGLPVLGLGLALPRLPLLELDDGPDRARLHQALSGLASLATAAG
jgi:4-hydroxy-tetrahydrodipicolinate synthase